MKQISIKNRLYVLPALLFFIGLQGTDTETNAAQSTYTQSNITHPNPDVYADTLTRKPHHHHNHHHNQNHNQEIDQNDTGSLQVNLAGLFDPTFNNTRGYVINPTGPNCEARAVAVQQNNDKIVFAGTKDNKAVVGRYNQDGSLDQTGFIDNGVVVTNIGGVSYFNAVAIQQNQRIVVAGRSDNKAVLARYNTNGSLDTSFGGTGIIRTGILGELNAIAIQENGKIVVAGYKIYNASNYTQVLLMRYNQDGSPDNNFNSNGTVLTSAGIISRANGVTIQEDGKIVIVGVSNLSAESDQDRVLVARYHPAGNLDHTGFGEFGNLSGWLTFRIGNKNAAAYDVKVQEDGTIVVVGTAIEIYNNNVFLLLRLDENGNIAHPHGITTFHVGNDAYNNSSYARSVVLDQEERIIVMGYSMEGPYNNLSIARFRPHGVLDQSFGTRGTVNGLLIDTNFNGNQAAVPFVGAIQNDKTRLVLAGSYSPNMTIANRRFAIARFLN